MHTSNILYSTALMYHPGRCLRSMGRIGFGVWLLLGTMVSYTLAQEQDFASWLREVRARGARQWHQRENPGWHPHQVITCSQSAGVGP